MEVTRQNFRETLPSIYTAIDRADFVAFDSEFTGLRRDSCRYNELDTAEERYVKARDSARDFGMIQFGLTTFRYVKETTTYHHATFCFYLHGRDTEVLAYNNASLRFLADSGLDFNKLFRDGLPYLSLQEAEAERAALSQESLEPPQPSPVKVAEEGAKKFLREAEAKMKKYISSETTDPLVFSGVSLTGFFRKLLYNNIAAKHDNILIRQVPGSHDRRIEVRKFSSPSARTVFLESERERKLEEKVGFTHIIQRILERGIPLAGHNMMLDILHTFHKTVRMLPDTLQQFKAEVCTTLPTIYDTKLISKDPPFCTDIPITALEKLFSSLCENYSPPNLEVEGGQPDGDGGGYVSHSIGQECVGRAHDAGYDAFMTGVCFITMVKNLDGANWKQKSVIHSKHLTQYANRINNMNSHDIPYISLVGPDVIPDRSTIFCVDCPPTWNTANVYGLFHMLKPVKVVWVNSCNLYVIPLEQLEPKLCRQHLKVIQAECPAQVRVCLYGDAKTHPPAPKRKSQNSEDMDADQTGVPARIQDYKRLKSVGSDQLSQMTLESPSMEEAPPIYARDGKKAKSPQEDGVFSVPDEW